MVTALAALAGCHHQARRQELAGGVPSLKRNFAMLAWVNMHPLIARAE